MATLYRTIVRPVITEKSSVAYQNRGEYTFEVASDASKLAIKDAIEKLFGVNVTGVQTMNVRGKRRRVGGTVGTRANWKKAIVTLKEGQTIEHVFEA
jgi:large subunit ribosomal protein L23